MFIRKRLIYRRSSLTIVLFATSEFLTMLLGSIEHIILRKECNFKFLFPGSGSDSATDRYKSNC